MSDGILTDVLDDNFDPRYVAAGDILVKIAADEGVDLEELSDEEIGGMLNELVESDAVGDEGDYTEDHGHEGGEAHEGGDDMGKESSVTHGVIARELSKIASSEGIDLGSLPQAEYDSLYNELANVMTQPGFQEKQAAAQEKLAEADAIGRAMAHSFDDELRKLASTEEQEKVALSTAMKARMYAEKARRGLKGLGERAMKAEAGASKRVGEAIRGDSARRAARKSQGAGRLQDRLKAYKKVKPGEEAKARRLGRAAMGAAAAGTAAGAGGAAMAMRDKKSYDEDVVATARALLAESGFNPDTGEKVAEDYDTAVLEGAVQLLQENGYTFD